MGYTKDAIRGVSWITSLRVLTRIVTFVRLAILGRLLTPQQFGFFGIASLILSLLEIITETGINVFLVQHKGEIKEYINSAWIVSIGRGILLATLILILSPFIASFFNSPQADSVIALISVVPFIRGFINPAIIMYQKELLFQKEFQFRSILFLVDAATSILVGLITHSAVSFAYGLIFSAIVEVILSYLLIPLWPKLQFEFQKLKHVVHKGWWVTLTVTFSFLAENGDNITIGKLLGSSSLGIYQVAYKFSTLPITEIANVVNQVIFPVYAKFSHDNTRLLKAFLKVTILSTFGAVLLGGAIFFLAKPIILIFMGEQWVKAVPAIQVLSLYGILRTIFGNFSPLFLSLEKQNYVAQTSLCRFIGLFVSVIPLVMMFGMVGAGYAMLFSILVEIPLILYFTYNIFKK